VVVGAASGAVGSVAGQIAKINGCRVAGIAGGPEKCQYVLEELRFDACVDHRDAAFPKRLAEAVSHGIDLYFENVGGAAFDAVWPHLNVHAWVPVCRLVAGYNGVTPDERQDWWPDMPMAVLQQQRIAIYSSVRF
jgi:NADPH-dependent curcumin reductase